MEIKNRHTYRFLSTKYPTMILNIYGTNSVATGRNVCLFNADPDDIMQDWMYLEEEGIGKRLHSVVDIDYVLDRSDGSLANSYINNAHMCKTTSTNANDSALVFEEVSGVIHRIRLANRNLYLTVANNYSGTPASSISNVNELTSAIKNIYWTAPYDYDDTSNFYKQCWEIVDTRKTVDEGEMVTTFPNQEYYTNSNPSYALGSEYVGECTWYCNGRALEKKNTAISAAKAKNWYGQSTSFTRYGPTIRPTADSIACFSGGSESGHVVYVEDVKKENGEYYIYFSEANFYNDPAKVSNGRIETPFTSPTGTDGVLKRMSWASFKLRSNNSYQGCIVL